MGWGPQQLEEESWGMGLCLSSAQHRPHPHPCHWDQLQSGYHSPILLLPSLPLLPQVPAPPLPAPGSTKPSPILSSSPPFSVSQSLSLGLSLVKNPILLVLLDP